MSILKVARLGNPVLLQKARPLGPDELASPAGQQFVDDLIDTMYDESGVGLAAPQVHESVRIFVMDAGEDHGGLRVVVNPELTFPGEDQMSLWEGCLSIPDVRGETIRHALVHVKCLDRQGQACEFEFEGFPAAVVQHETDHLDGILFLSRMPDLSRLSFEPEYRRYYFDADDELDEDAE